MQSRPHSSNHKAGLHNLEDFIEHPPIVLELFLADVVWGLGMISEKVRVVVNASGLVEVVDETFTKRLRIPASPLVACMSNAGTPNLDFS